MAVDYSTLRGDVFGAQNVFHSEKVLMKRSWREAEFFCEEFGAQLASFAHIEEEEFVNELLHSKFNRNGKPKRRCILCMRKGPRTSALGRTANQHKRDLTQLLKFAHQYTLETKQERKLRLLACAAKRAAGKETACPSSRVNMAAVLVENKKAQLVVTAHDTDLIDLGVFMPVLYRKMGVPYCVIKGKTTGRHAPLLPSCKLTQKTRLLEAIRTNIMTDTMRSAATEGATSWILNMWLPLPSWKRQMSKNSPLNWVKCVVPTFPDWYEYDAPWFFYQNAEYLFHTHPAEWDDFAFLCGWL
ncbi:hypothetical protein U0070_021212, partial [Myodes glareolus]